MPLSVEQKNNIEHVVTKAIRDKLKGYSPETDEMPFHYRLIGKDRIYLYRFIHSLNTTFGTSVFEPIAKIIAESNYIVTLKKDMGSEMSENSVREISKIMSDITTTQLAPNHEQEFNRIKNVCQKGGEFEVKNRKADVYLISSDKKHFAIDIKTAKPNIDGFEKYKRNSLQWIASTLYKDPTIDLCPMIAIPYNPYAPAPYKRWTLQGVFDLNKQLLVGEEFWNFLAGDDDVYEELLDCFERVGKALKGELDKYFSRFV